MVVGIIYTRVCNAFNLNRSITENKTNRIQRKLARRKKTNILLIMVSLVFFFSWAPMNIYNLVIDIGQPFQVTQQ